MHGVKKSASANTRRPLNMPSTNPFDSDDELENKQSLENFGRTSSEPSLFKSNLSTNPFDDEERSGGSSSQRNLSSASETRFKDDFRNSGGLENQSVQELEKYAVHRAEETTKTVKNCLKIAESIIGVGTETAAAMHYQGEQISRTHMVAAEMDHDLSMGEKLLGSLGGMFSRTWKPKKTRPITGPVITRVCFDGCLDDQFQRMSNHLERENLGLTSASKERTSTRTRTPLPEPTTAMQKIEVEKVKQDDALSDLSDALYTLKNIATDMRCVMDRQNKTLDHVQDDVEELNFRVKGANQRTRHLLGK